MSSPHKKPEVAVDIVLLTLKEGHLHVALHERTDAREPFVGALALPGGYVHVSDDASLEATARRVLRDKVQLRPRYLEQLYTFAGPERDPRGWSVAVSYIALVPVEDLQQGGKGIFHFHNVDELPPLAFDHNEQVQVAVTRVRNKSAYSTLPCWLLPQLFTMKQLQGVYESIMGEKIDKGTFRSRLGLKTQDIEAGDGADNANILIATNEFQRGKAQRPARFYQVDNLKLLSRSWW